MNIRVPRCRGTLCKNGGASPKTWQNIASLCHLGYLEIGRNHLLIQGFFRVISIWGCTTAPGQTGKKVQDVLALLCSRFKIRLEMFMKKNLPALLFLEVFERFPLHHLQLEDDGRVQNCSLAIPFSWAQERKAMAPSLAHQVVMTPPVRKPSSTPYLVNAWRPSHSQWMLCTYPTLSLRITNGLQKTPFNLCA